MTYINILKNKLSYIIITVGNLKKKSTNIIVIV